MTPISLLVVLDQDTNGEQAEALAALLRMLDQVADVQVAPRHRGSVIIEGAGP